MPSRSVYVQLFRRLGHVDFWSSVGAKLVPNSEKRAKKKESNRRWKTAIITSSSYKTVLELEETARGKKKSSKQTQTFRNPNKENISEKPKTSNNFNRKSKRAQSGKFRSKRKRNHVDRKRMRALLRKMMTQVMLAYSAIVSALNM